LKKKALVIGGTHNDAVPMAVFVINIKKTNPHLVDEIVIFHDGIPQKTQNLMNSIFPCRFEYYQFPGYKPSDFNNYVNKYFTPMVFCRYECLRLLNEYSVVMWSDYDVVILKDISELMEPCVSGIKLLWQEHCTDSIYDTFLSSIKDAGLSKYNLQLISWSSANIVLYDFLDDYMAMYQWCLDITRQLGRHLYLTELSIFNLLLQEFGLDPFVIPDNVFCVNPSRDRITDKAKILHAYGQPKFWNGVKNDIWEKNYQDWLAVGGRKLKERPFTVKRSIVQLVHIGKRFLPEILMPSQRRSEDFYD
jgi:lipopolysaccharide biosynthesis glycosyltransferase